MLTKVFIGTKDGARELEEAFSELYPDFRRATFYVVLVGMLMFVPTIYMMEVYGRVIASENILTLAMLLLLAVGAYILIEYAELVAFQILQVAGNKFQLKLELRVFDAVFQVSRFKLNGAIQGSLNDLRVVREFLCSKAFMGILELPVAIVYLIAVYDINPVMAGYSFFGASVQFLLGVMREKYSHQPLKESTKAASQVQSYADGALRNSGVIEALGMLNRIHGRWKEKQSEFIALQAIASESAAWNQSLSKLIQILQGSMLLGIGTWMSITHINSGGVKGAPIDPGLLIFASIIGGRILAPLVQVITQWQLVVSARDSYGNLNQLLKEIPAKLKTMELPPPVGHLTVESIGAIAPGTQMQVLRNIAFELKPGESCAVVGPSASGKSSLAKLLVGAWPSNAGKVRLDGADVFTWDKDLLGKYLGYLPQEVELFGGSITENIARFGEADISHVREVAQEVGISEFIESLPKGYATLVGDGGSFLSGGQRQKIGIARAIYGQAKFVVLDEPNANLDQQGDLSLEQLMHKLKEKVVTVVLITHRPAILKAVDKILVLKDGNQIMFGNRDDVLSKLQGKVANQPASAAQPTKGGSHD